jgi:adenosine deaminase
MSDDDRSRTPETGARPRVVRRIGRALALVLLVVGGLAAAPAPSDEAATAKYFASIRNQPAMLLVFLREMPKGGDLHNHLSGAIYAESYLRWAADDGLCVLMETMTLVPPPCTDKSSGRPPATAVFADSALYSQAIDAMSMRNWNPALNGHDHFFATFSRFGLASGRTGDMLAEVAARAAAEHVAYLELMVTTTGAVVGRVSSGTTLDRAHPDFPGLRDHLLAAGLRDAVTAEATQRIEAAEARERDLLRCGAPDADPGCRVALRYLVQVARAGQPASVFAQMLAGFELATREPRIVALNLVQPEDDPTAIGDFTLQMKMLDFLQPLYPSVKITLHAGELADGLVPPESLRFHIRQSVELGHARRIGHGVDVMHEDDALALLKEMAARKVLVEIALTSNDVILGVRGKGHPLHAYLTHGVPVALVTDDAGVSRSSLTLEFLKGVEDQGLDYLTLKKMVRNSIEYSFADAATKTRLHTELDAAFRAFERTRNR